MKLMNHANDRDGFKEWLWQNLICGDKTQSFVDRMHEKRYLCLNLADARKQAHDVIEEMWEEYRARRMPKWEKIWT